jgi:hypothetical protein
MVELQPSKLAMRVRSPSPALTLFEEVVKVAACDAVEGSGLLLITVSSSIEDPFLAAGFVLGGLSVSVLGLFAVGGGFDYGPLSCENN